MGEQSDRLARADTAAELRRTRAAMIGATLFIHVNCVFWAGMDVWVYRVEGHWTLYTIYLPVFVLFVPVLWGWARLSVPGLLAASGVSLLVCLALLGYGVFLLGSQPGWGVVTLLFVPLLVVLGVSSYRAARRLTSG